VATPPVPDATNAPTSAPSLEEVGRNDLGARGLNSALALADNCAYVGSRGQAPVAVLDIADPAHPAQVGSLAARAGTSTRELRADERERLLVVMSLALTAQGANRFDLYRWAAGDCAHPAVAGFYDFGAHSPHEFFYWAGQGRRLLFASMFGAGGSAAELQVIEVTDPTSPRRIGSWSSPVGILHSISIDPDNRRAYLSLWTSGFAVADVSDFTSNAANPQVRLLTPAGSFLRPLPGGNVHSAVRLADGNHVLLTDERYPPNCPYGPARIVDVSDPANLRAVATLKAPENDPAACARAPTGTYTSHNPTLTTSLALISWYSSGLQVFDVSDPANPVRLAEFRPTQTEPGQRDPALGATQAMTWSYPVLRNGLIYVADVNQGLEVLRYHGPHQDEPATATLKEGNSNLAATQQSPSPSPSAQPQASPPTPQPSGKAATTRSRVSATQALLALALLLAAAATATALVMRRRRGRP